VRFLDLQLDVRRELGEREDGDARVIELDDSTDEAP
jgi:hypothetical protein